MAIIRDDSDHVVVTSFNDVPTGGLVVPGQLVVGVGPVGNDKRGPALVCPGEGLIFSGGAVPYQATGCGARDLRLVKAAGNFGGTALRVSGESDALRSGEGRFVSLTVASETAYGSGVLNSTWDYGVVVDGSLLVTPGGAGIRRTYFEGVRTHSTAKKAIWLRNAVHCELNFCQVDPGTQPAGCVLHIDGGQNIQAVGLICNGMLLLDSVVDAVIQGPYLGDVVVKSNCRNVVITGNCRGLVIETGATGKFIGNVSGPLSQPLSSTWGFKVYR